MRGDTICALCSPKGKGAVSLIRISGPKALEIVKKLASFLPLSPESHRVYFGILSKEGKAMDQVLITYFAKGRSFTGEESLEISCHGGDIYNDILKALLEKGARLAEKGEFSLQAFSNGKMDLVQAEALLQFIESKNEITRKQAFSQLQGQLSKKLKAIEKKWLELLSHLEADIDFALEGLNTFEEEQIETHLEELKQEISPLLESYRPFENLQKGLIFGIFGLSNVGKSSLFNALLSEDKAIVSKEEGTTRDILEGFLLSPYLSITLKDSAGFRFSQSEGEQKGQIKAKNLFYDCDYKIVLLDAVNFEKQEQEDFLFKEASNTLLVFTKKDLVKKNLSVEKFFQRIKKRYKDYQFPEKDRVFLVSSLTKEGLSPLKQKILSFAKITEENFFLSNYRHYKGLTIMKESLDNSLLLLKKEQGEKDLMALELRQGLLVLYEILGKQIDDQILDCIFKEFCIGK